LDKDGKRFTVYVRREGRITIPKEIRDAANIEEGDLVECTVKLIKTRRGEVAG
jgi:AbrB family looped-hinge helix DNA binding protein